MKLLLVIKGLLTLVGLAIFMETPSLVQAKGRVVDKTYEPPRIERIEYYSIIQDAPMTRRVEVSEKYILKVEFEGREKKYMVTEEEFVSIDVGDKYND